MLIKMKIAAFVRCGLPLDLENTIVLCVGGRGGGGGIELGVRERQATVILSFQSQP